MRRSSVLKTVAAAVFCVCCLYTAAAADMNDIAGTYEIEVDSPVGPEKGTVCAEPDGKGGFAGSITLFGNTNSFADGVFDGKTFAFSGKMKFLFFRIPYTVTGTFDGSVIEAVAATSAGDMKITGRKVSPPVI